jgi:hypothetical protein
MKAGTPHEAAKNTRSVAPRQGSVVIGPTPPPSPTLITHGPEFSERIAALEAAWTPAPAAGVLPTRELTAARAEAIVRLKAGYTTEMSPSAKALRSAYNNHKENATLVFNAEHEYLKATAPTLANKLSI